MAHNTLYYGDNLDILRRYIPDDTIDLIYLDPPFNSQQAYNVIFAENNGAGSSSQIEAFDDTWHWTTEAMDAYEQVLEHGGESALGGRFGRCTRFSLNGSGRRRRSRA